MKFLLDSVWNIFASCKVPVTGYSAEYLPQQARSTRNSMLPMETLDTGKVFSSRGKAEIERRSNFETL
jgi:hypothetical protein